jgi:hypothetical protein
MRLQGRDIQSVYVWINGVSVEIRRFPAMRLAHSFGPHLGTGIAMGWWRSRMAEGAVEERPKGPWLLLFLQGEIQGRQGSYAKGCWPR